MNSARYVCIATHISISQRRAPENNNSSRYGVEILQYICLSIRRGIQTSGLLLHWLPSVNADSSLTKVIFIYFGHILTPILLH